MINKLNILLQLRQNIIFISLLKQINISKKNLKIHKNNSYKICLILFTQFINYKIFLRLNYLLVSYRVKEKTFKYYFIFI